MNILISSNSNGGDSTNVLQHRQISSTTRPNTIMRTPDHYEMIDQIGKGEKIFFDCEYSRILCVFPGFLTTPYHGKNLSTCVLSYFVEIYGIH